MSFTIAKKFRFAASHQLTGLPEGHKCQRLHGHTYEVEVVVTADFLDNGMILDYGELTEIVAPLIARCDHRHLNDIIEQPTAERIASWFYSRVAEELKGKRQLGYGMGLERVRVCESPETWAEYRR